MKRQSTDWEKIFTNNVTNKELQTACDTKPHQNKQPTQKCTKEINSNKPNKPRQIHYNHVSSTPALTFNR